jgi:hypothetical protein
MDRFNIEWKSAEKLPGIVYSDNGNSRKYKADFLVAEKYLVEIKPKKLQNTSSNLAKKAAALSFCEQNGLKYKMTDIGCFSLKEMFEMHEKGVIKLPEVYVKKLLLEKTIHP